MSIGLLNRSQLQEVEALLRELPFQYMGDFVDPFPAAGSVSHQQLASSSRDQQLLSLSSSSTLSLRHSQSGLNLQTASERDTQSIPPPAPAAANWTIAQAALYLGWWSFAPTACSACGSTGFWFPSLDEEYRCGSCSTGAGSTKTNEIVEDFGGENDWQDNDDEQEDLAHDAGMPELGFLPTLQHFIRILRDLDSFPECQGSLGSSRIPQILRIAVNILHLTLLPDLGGTEDPQADNVMKAASLFLACSIETLHSVPFPLFQKAAKCEVLWVDVEHLAAEIGLQPDALSFFTQLDASMKNFMVLIPSNCRPPGIVWSLDQRLPGMRDYAQGLKQLQRETFSPDHTAACVLLELLRKFEVEQRSRPEYLNVMEWCRRTRERLIASSPTTDHFINVAFDALPSASSPPPQQTSSGGLEGSPVPKALDSLKPLLDSEFASVFLVVVANVFLIHPLAMADVLRRIGFYGGTIRLTPALHQMMSRGFYPIPLTRRCSPFTSPWLIVYKALHSEDRFLLLQLLHVIASAPQLGKDLQPAVRTVQAILRKFGSSSKTLFYYCLKVSAPQGGTIGLLDEADAKAVKGTYFCSSVDADSATFCSFTGMKSITFPSSTQGSLLLEAVHLQAGKVLPTGGLSLKLLPPLFCQLESTAAKLLIDCAATGLGAERFSDAVARIEARMTVRRQLLAGADEEIALVLKECRPYISASSRYDFAIHCNSITLLSKLSVVGIASSFEEFLRSLPAALIHCLTDSEAARRVMEYKLLKDAAHPSVTPTDRGSPVPTRATNRKRPANRGEEPPRSYLDRGQGARRLLREAVPQLQRSLQPLGMNTEVR